MSEQNIENRIQAYEYLHKVTNGKVTPEESLLTQARTFFSKEELLGMILIDPPDASGCFPGLARSVEAGCSCKH